MEKELPMYYKVGLNDSEVQERIAKGQVNGVSKPVSKSYGQIIKDKDRKSTRLNSSHSGESRMPSSA